MFNTTYLIVLLEIISVRIDNKTNKSKKTFFINLSLFLNILNDVIRPIYKDELKRRKFSLALILIKIISKKRFFKSEIFKCILKMCIMI